MGADRAAEDGEGVDGSAARRGRDADSGTGVPRPVAIPDGDRSRVDHGGLAAGSADLGARSAGFLGEGAMKAV